MGGGGTPVVQFQYIDVGVNMDITPRVLRNREVSMTVLVQVAGTAGDADLGGVILPIFSNREIRHEIRLKEGETNVLGGLISNAESNAISGLPGLSKIPFIGRLFSRESAQDDATEIIVLLTPHIIKMADVTQINLEGLRVGTQNDIRLRQPLPVEPPPAPVPQAGLELPPANAIRVAAELPASLQLTVDGVPLPSGMVSAAPGVETTLELRMAAENMIGADLTLEFDPGSIILRSITEGGLLSKDGTPVGLVQSIDRDRGIVEISLDRPADSPAISGEGALLQLKVEGLNPGASRVNVGGMSIRTGDPAPETQAAQVITNQ